MKLKRHKQFLKDLRKVKMTDEQFQRLAKYLTLLTEGRPLPPFSSFETFFSICRSSSEKPLR